MKRWSALLAVLLLSACAGPVDMTKGANYDLFDEHCREHARDMYAEDSEQRRYNECMDLHRAEVAVQGDPDEHFAADHW